MTTQTPIYTTTSRELIRMYNERTQGQGHFFDPDTMRFFNSRIMRTVYYAGPSSIVFVTSERFDWNTPRRYTVRVWDGKSVNIDDVGEFQAYDTSQKAHRAAQAYAREMQAS